MVLTTYPTNTQVQKATMGIITLLVIKSKKSSTDRPKMEIQLRAP